MDGHRMKYWCAALAIISLKAFSQMPGFDIYLGDLSVVDNQLKISQLQALTQRPEYDNQPWFLPDGQSLLYTSARMKNGQEQTDSILVSLESGKSTNLTDTTLSEYSPTLMPDGKSFAVIHVENQKQKLWRYPLKPTASPASELLSNVEPVGYQAWIDSEQVILFVLGEPHTLQLANVKQQTSQILDQNVGPSLYAIPNTSHMSYSTSAGKGDDIRWTLKSYQPKNMAIKVLTTLPKGAYYYGWSGDGKAIAAVDSQIYQWDMLRPKEPWKVFADVSQSCPKGVSRLTTNQQNTKIALVCTL
jgi:hypothetical protein